MDKIKKEIIDTAERTLHYTDLLIKQCDSWLSAEEGNKAMEEKILNRIKKNKSLKKKNHETAND